MANEYSLRLYSMLHHLGRQMHRFAYSFKQDHDHYREQSKLLFLIAQNEGIIQRDLAEEMDVRPSSMTAILTKMEQRGLVLRRQDEKDQRITHIFLTEEGKAAAKQSQDATEQMADNLFKGLSDEEIKQMLELTLKLCDTVRLNALDEETRGHRRKGRHHTGGDVGGHGHHHRHAGA